MAARGALTPRTPSRQATLLVDFWLAAKVGEKWLRLHAGLRPALGQLPGECALLAHGEQFAAGRLLRAQRFASRAWWRAGMALAGLTLVVIGITAALDPGTVGTDIAVVVIFALGCGAGLAILQMALLSFRAAQVRLYLSRAGSAADDEPLSAGSLGLPSRWDFWCMTAVAVVLFAVLLFAGTRTPHG
jgi:hypothetical protein